MVKLRIFIFILIIAILGVGAYFVMIHTDNLSSDFSTFYVEYDGHHLAQSSDAIYEKGSVQRFDVKYTFDFLSKEQKGYSVKIVPNGKAETAEYVIDGKYYAFSGLSDITSAFDMELNDSYFTLSIPKDFTIKTVLDKIYPNKTVEVNGDYDISEEKFYTLIISSYDGAISYSVNFGIAVKVRGVTLDITRIEF